LSHSNIKLFSVQEDIKIIDVLKKIDFNKKGFVTVVDSSNVLKGILTDGDIRRALIGGITLDCNISSLYNKTFECIYLDYEIGTIVEKFKSEELKFLPILDQDNHLIDVLTKKQFHVLLLKDIEFNLENLPEIAEEELDYEIFSRPWGFYKSTIIANHSQSKVIYVLPDSSLSLQEHKKREEHWVIIKGKGKVILGESELNVYPGKYIYIPKGCKHKISNTSSNNNLIFTEVQLGDYFGEDDIIRYEDKYGRI